MAAFPFLRGSTNQQVLFPLTRRVSFETLISFFSDGSEQRGKSRAPLFEFDLTLAGITAADVNQWLTTHANAGGMATSNLSLTIGSTTWNNLALQTDIFGFEQNELGNIYTVIVKAIQTQNGGFTIPSVSPVWPTFSSGAKLQYPFSAAWRNLSTVSNGPTGKRYGYEWWGAGVAKQPTRQLRKWKVELVLPDADVPTLETFFTGMQGRLTTFSFTDPFNSTTYAPSGAHGGVRFDSDVLELNYRDINKTGVSIGLVEVN